MPRAHLTDNHPPTRLGVIGVGLAVEKLHWPALRRLDPAFRIVAFCDRDEAAARHFSTFSGVPMAAWTADHQELLRRDDVDAVLITLPIPLLYPIAKDALEAGKHVIGEKPPGVDEAQAHQFLALAAAHAERRLLVAENAFYRDDLRFARWLLEQGAIGRVHLMAWRTVAHNVPRAGQFSSTPWRQRTQYRGGAHLDAGVHHIAQIRLLLGDVSRVHGEVQSANRTLDAPSDLTLNLRFGSEAIGSYAATYPELAVQPEGNQMHLYGTDGVMVLGGSLRGDRWIEVQRPDSGSERHVVDTVDGGYTAEWLNFRQALTHDAPILATVDQSVKNLLVIERGLDSAEQQQVVSFADQPGGVLADAVPIWMPWGATGLLEDGLLGEHRREASGMAAG